MTTIQNGAFDRDANYVPITLNGFTNISTKSLSANNTTAQVPIFSVTGQVEILGLYGVVTTALSSNITAAYWRSNDGTSTPAISLATGTTLSSFAVGSLITRRSIVSVALVGVDASASFVQDPVAATAPGVFMPFILGQKTAGVTTNVEFVYTTTNAPATGAIKFYIGWIPLTEDSYITSL